MAGVGDKGDKCDKGDKGDIPINVVIEGASDAMPTCASATHNEIQIALKKCGLGGLILWSEVTASESRRARILAHPPTKA